jgi:hypothetical protein
MKEQLNECFHVFFGIMACNIYIRFMITPGEISFGEFGSIVLALMDNHHLLGNGAVLNN